MIDTQLAQVRQQLLASSRPLFLFDDDPDGLASFLLLYRAVRAGKGMPLKGKPVDEALVERVNLYQPDLIVILDKHSVEDEFFRGVHAPVIWLDHHTPQEVPANVLYVNPRMNGENLPTSHLAYRVRQDDVWLAVTGIVSDWMLPEQDIWERCEKEYPEFLPPKTKTAPDALFDSQAGRIARLFSFVLKGRTKHVMTAMKILSRINKPEELLEEQHAQARLVMKTLKKLEKEYLGLLNSIEPTEGDPVIAFEYSEASTSYTTDLSNELLHRYPKHVILIARRSNGSYKCSLRAAEIRIDEILGEVLQHVKGDGGGHEHACGAVIDAEDFEHFKELLRAKVAEQ